MPRKPRKLVGLRFGRLTVIKDLRRRQYGNGSCRRVQVKCDCTGVLLDVFASNLTNGHIRSCGCLRIKHGDAIRTRQITEYSTWKGMKARCLNSSDTRYPNYGGRGITVCARWLSYRNFLADMGRRPTPNHSIDRKDNDGNYEPSNCRWATRIEQAANKSRK